MVGMVGMLGSLSAESGVARFLVSLSERYTAMGYSGTSFNLRMTRQQIGSDLGLTLETVSRTFSGLHNCGYITVDRATIGICGMQALRTLRRLPPSATRGRQTCRPVASEQMSSLAMTINASKWH